MRTRVALSLFVFLLLWVHGSTLGLSDDEAYYWVLAQRPAMGYAFHPPAVAWIIAFFQFCLSPIFGTHSVALLRLPAALASAGVLFMVMAWLESFQEAFQDRFDPKPGWRSGFVVLAYFGFFALSWMMVPDISLFFGFTLVFVTVWAVCFDEEALLPPMIQNGLLALGGGVLMLSKYSAVLTILSGAVALALWAPHQRKRAALGALSVGFGLGLIPILIWNAQHEWASLLYQVRDRHGHDFSIVRFARFWGIQLVLAGPVVLATFFYWGRRIGSPAFLDSEKPLHSYCLLFAIPPALIYGLQPLFSDFKPHWALIAWFPVVLGLAAENTMNDRGITLKMRFHLFYGAVVSLFIFIGCHMSLPALFNSSSDIKLDVTNDFYGWSDLNAGITTGLTREELALPLVGSRYQTAAQAAFNLEMTTTFLPRSPKEFDEWPNLAVTDSQGPEWPTLLKPVLFVTDNRYDAPPEFKSAQCTKRLRVEGMRDERVAKWIELWRCDPIGTAKNPESPQKRS